MQISLSIDAPKLHVNLMSSDRTEKASPKRREDARKKGQVARRPELGGAIGFFAALMMLRATGEDMFTRASQLFPRMVFQISTASDSLTVPLVHNMVIDACLSIATLALPVIAASLVAGLVSNIAQGGLTVAVGALAPKAERFNPISNLKRAFGGGGPLEFVKGIVKLTSLAGICYGVFARVIADAPSLVGAPASQAFAAVGQLTYDLSLRAGSGLVLLAGADYGYGLYKHEKSLRMTKQEVKDEYRQQEGDPMIKSQRRRAARALTQRRFVSEVPQADVIVTNPTHFAVALRYDREKDAAPKVVAKGMGAFALYIRKIARRHEVMVVENPLLARSLYRTVKEGQTIPAEFFRAVAELLAYVYRQRERTRGH